MDLENAKSLALSLMSRERLTPLWTLHFSRCLTKFGQCDFGRKRIILSRPLIEHNFFSQVDETVRHEIAHCLAGPGHGHDAVWKKIAIRLGAEPRACYDESVIEPPKKFIGRCPNCSFSYERFRRNKFVGCYGCATAYLKANPSATRCEAIKKFLIVWTVISGASAAKSN